MRVTVLLSAVLHATLLAPRIDRRTWMTATSSDIAAPTGSVFDPDVAAVIEWWTAHARPLPWRSTRDVYAVWVSEVMSAQTTVNRAADAWVRWMDRWPTVEALAEA